jgi:histidine triad (HIT) family protein
MTDCIFCQIICRKLPAEVVYEDNETLGILDIDPISDGHTLVLPKSDTKDIFSLNETDGGKIMSVAKKLARVIQDEYAYDTIMLMQVNGLSQDHPHFHLHVFGRNKSNDIKIDYPTGVSKDAEYLHEVALNMQKKLQMLSPSK